MAPAYRVQVRTFTTCTWTISTVRSIPISGVCPRTTTIFFPHDAAVSPELSLLTDATLRHSVTLIGSEPYVEPTSEQGKMNIFDIAL